MTAPDRRESVEALCRATAETGLFTGAVLVAKDGEILYQGAFGFADREWDIANTVDTKFRLASVSKQFCSMLVLQLVQEGRLRLEDTITDHLSYYRKDTGDRITLHHLLAHQSGIRDYTAGFDYRGTVSRLSIKKDDFIREHCSGDLMHEPGTLYSYCNAGYSILGRIIEKVTRKTLEQNLQERIFGPLGMKHSGYDRNRTILEKRARGYTRGAFGYTNADFMEMDSSPGAAGALYSTVGDMFLWDRALYTNALLEDRFREQMFTPNQDVPEVKAAGGRPKSRYGYGWQIYHRTHPLTQRRTKIINHGGAINGFRAMEHRLVEDDAFIIVLCNQGDAPGNSEVWNAVTNLANELVHVVTGQPYRMPGPPRLTQEQRMYKLVQEQGVEAALKWFNDKGRKAAWGGTNMALARQLIEDGLVTQGLQILDFDIQLTPGKVWMLRQAAEAQLNHGTPERALELTEQGLALKPEDEVLKQLRLAAQQDLSQTD